MSDPETVTQTKRPSAGVIGFAIALLVLTAIGSLLKDSQGLKHAAFIGPITVMGLIWGSAFFSFFIVWMLYYAYYILPGSSLDQWNIGFRLLMRYYIRQSATYIRYLFSKSRLRKKERTRRSVKKEAVADDPKPLYEHSFDQLGVGIVPTHIVLALDNTSKKTSLKSVTEFYKTQHGKPINFSRAAGPGIVVLKGNVIRKTEKIMRKIDLRPHLRKASVQAVTRDGINIKTNVIVIFHVNRADTDDSTHYQQDEEHYALYPYDIEDIRRLRYDHKEEWYIHIAPRAGMLLAAELSSLTLDDLHDAEGATIQHLRDTVKEKLDAQINPTITTIDDAGNEVTTKKNSGITIVMVNLFSIEEPPEIQEHRFELWKKEMEEELEVIKLQQDAESAKRIQDLRAMEQRNIVNNTINSIQSIYDAQNITQTEVVTLRMVAALEEAMKSKDLMVMTPQMLTHWVTDTIKQMHTLLDMDEKE